MYTSGTLILSIYIITNFNTLCVTDLNFKGLMDMQQRHYWENLVLLYPTRNPPNVIHKFVTFEHLQYSIMTF